MATNLAFSYTGAYRDAVTGGYPLGNGYRTYMPGLSRFSAPDELSPFAAGGLNPYVYCDCDPINRLDPSGHFSLGSFLIGEGINLFVSLITAPMDPVGALVNFTMGTASGYLGAAGDLKAAEIVDDVNMGGMAVLDPAAAFLGEFKKLGVKAASEVAEKEIEGVAAKEAEKGAEEVAGRSSREVPDAAKPRTEAEHNASENGASKRGESKRGTSERNASKRNEPSGAGKKVTTKARVLAGGKAAAKHAAGQAVFTGVGFGIKHFLGDAEEFEALPEMALEMDPEMSSPHAMPTLAYTPLRGALPLRRSEPDMRSLPLRSTSNGQDLRDRL